MMSNDRTTAPVEWTDLGWSLACHAVLVLLAALVTLLIVHPPEVGVETAAIAAEFQLFEAPASESAPAEVADTEPVPPSVLPPTEARGAIPDYLRNPPPAYPEPSRLAHEEGVVMLVVDVGHSGNPTGVRLQQSSGFTALDQAAIRAVRDWKFRPATTAGMVVASSVSIPVRFELH